MIGEREGLFSSRYTARMYVSVTHNHHTTFSPSLLHWKLGHFLYVDLFMADSLEIVQHSYRAEKDDEIDLVIGDVSTHH